MRALLIELDNDRKGQSGLGFFKDEKWPNFILIPELDNLIIRVKDEKLVFSNLSLESSNDVQGNYNFLRGLELTDEQVRLLVKTKNTQEELNQLQVETKISLDADNELLPFLTFGSIWMTDLNRKKTFVIVD